MVVKKNRMAPIPKADAQTCWGAKGRGSRLAKAHMVKAGAA